MVEKWFEKVFTIVLFIVAGINATGFIVWASMVTPDTKMFSEPLFISVLCFVCAVWFTVMGINNEKL